MITRRQLMAHGYGRHAIDHRLERGRLHRVWPGVYAVGRPELTELGRLMAAVLACGCGAALSHESAGALVGVIAARPGPIHVSVPGMRAPRRPGIVVHRRLALDVVTAQGIPVTSPACTLVDLATRLSPAQLEAAINEADKLGLIGPDALRAALDDMRGLRGAAIVRRVIDRRTFALTDSELERRFLPLARRAGLPPPRTQARVNGFRVDFHWPELGLIVETDGLHYHRTPAQQAKDRRRDQAHAAAGLTALRFTHGQVAFEREHVCSTLVRVARRLAAGG